MNGIEYRRLGRTGLKVSPLCLGSMNFGWTADEKTSFAVMDAFAEAGGNFIDTADIYSRWVDGNNGGVSEEVIGRWLRARGNRSQMIIATKVRGQMGPGRTIRASAEGTSLTLATPLFAACRATQSTSIRPISSTQKRLSTRRWRRWIAWFSRAKCATSAVATIRPGA